MQAETTISSEALETKKHYVLDTSVFLSDPNAMFRFEDNVIIIPLVVIRELEAKRHDHELGYFARQALRNLEEVRQEGHNLTNPIALDNGGLLIVDVARSSDFKLFTTTANSSNDHEILVTAKRYEDLGRQVTVVSKDLPMRLIASALGLEAEEYKSEIKSNDYWGGVENIEVTEKEFEILHTLGVVKIVKDEPPAINTGFIVKSGTSSLLAVYVGDNQYVHIPEDQQEVLGVHGTSAEQRIAIAHLLATDVGIVSIGGHAGTGKSAMALLAGIEAVMEHGLYKKVQVFRPMYAVGGQELGFLPGSQEDKIDPWTQAVYDTLEPLISQNVMDEIKSREYIEVLPLTHIRGRSLHSSFVIVDEAQSLERNVLLTMLSRIGKNSKVVLTHDVAQRDNLRVGRFDGIVSVIEALKGSPLFAHVTLKKSERSAIADLVTKLLDF